MENTAFGGEISQKDKCITKSRCPLTNMFLPTPMYDKRIGIGVHDFTQSDYLIILEFQKKSSKKRNSNITFVSSYFYLTSLVSGYFLFRPTVLLPAVIKRFYLESMQVILKVVWFHEKIVEHKKIE